MTAQEARRVIGEAEAALVAYARWTAGLTIPGDWPGWADELARHLGRVLIAVRERPAASHVLPDRSAWLSPADLGVVIGALTQAALTGGPAGATRYAAVRLRLGDDR